MRVYNRKDFMALPEGTIYLKGEKWVFHGFSVKHDTLKKDNGEAFDWIYTDLTTIDSHDSGEWGERLEEMLEGGKSYPINKDAGRDGCFDDDELFLVFEKDDLLTVGLHIELALGE